MTRIRSVAIIGAQGRMGRLFKNLSYEAELEVRELDQPLEPELLARTLPGVDLVLLAVPIAVFEPVVAAVVPHLGPEQILADLCSVKVKPLEQMLAAHAGPVVGTHPLFGPLPPPEQAGQLRVAVCPGRDQASAAAVALWLADLDLVPFTVSAEEHDQAMAYIQGLNFVTSACYFAATAGQPGVERFLTPSYRRRMAAAEKMLTEDASMFEAIFEANPYSQEAVRVFRSFLNLAAGGDVNLLIDRASGWWKT